MTEEERRELHQALNEQLGARPANTLMSAIPPAGWADVATERGALAVLTAGDIDLLRTELSADVTQLRAGVTAGFERTRAELHKEIARSQCSLFLGLAGMLLTMTGILAGLVVAVG